MIIGRASLMDAVRHDGPSRVATAVPVRRYPGHASGVSSEQFHRMIGVGTASNVICRPMWTEADFRTFDFLTQMVCAGDPKSRAQYAKWLDDFKRKHGAEKCDMMLAEIRRRDAQAYFKGKEERQCTR
jgi:hypothetical protein